MRIVRIAENAINIYLSEKDLASRNLAADTLKEDSHEFDKLVWDAIDHANIEFGHEFEDRQLSIVNKYDGNGGLVLTISHDAESSYGDEDYIKDPNNNANKKIDRYFRNILRSSNSIYPDKYADNGAYDAYEEFDEDGAEFEDNNQQSDDMRGNDRHISAVLNVSPDELKELLRRINMIVQDSQLPGQQAASGGKRADVSRTATPDQKSLSPVKFTNVTGRHTAASDWDVLIFPEMNDMLEFFSRNKSFKSIASSLYSYRGAYYLVLKPNSRNLNMLNRLESLVIDYNATYLPAETFLPLLKERGTLIMETGAISKLISYFEL